MSEWDGKTERRNPTKDGMEGRRQTDWHCGDHFEIQSHTKEHRETVCAKIKEVKGNLSIEVEKLEQSISELNRNVVGKYWFRIVVGGLCAALVYIGFQQNWAFREIITNQKEFAVAVNNIENKQIEMSGQMKVFELEIKDLTKRQDILRDINIKQRQNDGRYGRDGNIGRDGMDAK
jgi:hypothetical protein